MFIEFQIPNWQKFNPRSDKANYTWFRFENQFFHDQAVFGLTDAQRIIYIFLLCESSKKNGGTVRLSADYLSAMLRRAQSDILKDFDHLCSVRLLTSDGRPKTDLVPATNERTNETNERNETNKSVSDQSTIQRRQIESVNKDAMEECKQAWLGTLSKFGAGRTGVTAEEEILIARAIQRWGALGVKFAILGKRAEPKSDSYDPGKNLSLSRILNHQEPEKYERLMNLGVQAYNKGAL